MPKKVIIIGGGLTGLTTAFYLKKAGFDVLVMEKDAEPGGAMKTVYQDGFTIETGANTGILGNPEVAELFDELGTQVQLEIANPKAKKRFILKNGRFRALPSGLLSAIGTPLFTWHDKFRVMGEPFRKRSTNPNETIAQIVRRRMGRSFLDYAIDPFVSGIYAGDPNKLVMRYALPKMWALEDRHGSFIVGGIKRSRQMKNDIRLQRATRDTISVQGGFGNLINALADNIGRENIWCNTQNITTTPLPGGSWQVTVFQNNSTQQIQGDYIISTVGAHALPGLLPFLKNNQLKALTNVVYAKVIEIALGFKIWKGGALNGFGGLIPSKENRKILGILFPSVFLQNRAPRGGALLTIYMGGIRHPGVMDLSDEDIKNIVLKEVTEILQCGELQPDVVRIFRHLHAIPQYEANTGERLEMIKEVQAQYPGLIIGGNLRDGIGMADRIKQAADIVSGIRK